MFLDFPYYQNYLDLVRMELNALASVTKGRSPRKFAVLGSGPLPMTSLCISQSFDNDGEAVIVHNVDRDPWAITKSTALCRRLGHCPEQVVFHRADVEEDQTLDLHGVDVVYLAGLVGTNNEQKQRIIAKVVKQMSPGAMLLLRSAHSMRSLLYPVRSHPYRVVCPLSAQQRLTPLGCCDSKPEFLGSQAVADCSSMQPCHQFNRNLPD